MDSRQVGGFNFQRTAEANANQVGFNRLARKNNEELKNELLTGEDKVSLGEKRDEQQVLVPGKESMQPGMKVFVPDQEVMPEEIQIPGPDGKPTYSTQITPQPSQQVVSGPDGQPVTGQQSPAQQQVPGSMSPQTYAYLQQLVDSGKMTPEQLQKILDKDKARRDMQMTMLKHEETERLAVRDALDAIQEQAVKAEVDRMKRRWALLDYIKQAIFDIWTKRSATNQAIADSRAKALGW
ncbi:MAG TPA: hypothetical protein PL110_02805 [Candidatus Eremiobacteraeota bacterium]|nr:MAG: hypothetical protein BWY64_01610 [bacterium ADurb.Bin363]HPZ07017.1 hypothetical protein [Candidatus Eremiobacteraeota bacterium]